MQFFCRKISPRALTRGGVNSRMACGQLTSVHCTSRTDAFRRRNDKVRPQHCGLLIAHRLHSSEKSSEELEISIAPSKAISAVIFAN